MKFAAIFLLILLSYIGAHFFVYFSLINFFQITSARQKSFMALALIFLGISFFISRYFAHVNENAITKAYYFASGFWIGFMINLMLFFTLASILKYLMPFLSFKIPLRVMATAAILFALIYSLYGVWNAFSPKVKNIEVFITNLPEQWKGKKIVLITDVHLGLIYGEKYMLKVAEQINALNPEIILISGDLFDGTDGDLKRFAEPLNKLKAKKGIYFATGNHETYLGVDKALKVLDKTKIVALQDQLKIVEGLQIIGLDYPPIGKEKNIRETIEKLNGFDKNKTSILLWHIPNQIPEVKEAGVSLQLSGHSHKGQLFPFGFITKAVFKGYDYGLKQDGNFSVYTSSGLGSWGPPMRTESRSEIVEITLK